MELKKNRRGSHVGIIASFAVFVMFLIGIYFVFEPMLKVQKDKQSLLEYLEAELLEEFSDDLTKVVINSSSGNCLEVQNIDVGVPNGVDAVVKDSSNNIVNSSFNANTLIIAPISETILWIHYALVDFENTTASESGCDIPTIKSITTTKEIFESKIIEDINHYNLLKEGLNIPPGSEFSLSFEMSNRTTLSAGEKDVSGNIYVKETPIQYIDDKANSLAGKIIIKVW